MTERALIEVTGQVQGVGFRPFVYRLADELGLSGWVMNDARGVRVDIQGTAEEVARFAERLKRELPPLARIDSMTCCKRTPGNHQGFAIRASGDQGRAAVPVAPDQGICEDCHRELFDPQSRFYRYPFINCTNCGPRFTIIKGLPYDRPMTSMAAFPLCEPCDRDYHNPLDRRYHAQPVSCKECGPSVLLLGSSAEVQFRSDSAIVHTARLIAAGGVVAIKGLGGFHLACDATKPAAVDRLRQLKRRARKPLAVMAGCETVARRLVLGNQTEWQTMTSQAAPIVLMSKQSRTPVAENVAPGVPCLGVMLPYTPLHLLLMDELKKLGASQTLVMTSANLSGLPIAVECRQVFEAFGDALDGVLDHNRPIVNPCDDSLVQFAGGEMRTLRLARGYAPLSFAQTGKSGKSENAEKAETAMAAGAQQKSSLALAVQDLWLLSSYLGDMDDLDTQQRYLASCQWLTELYRTRPAHWVCDRHPGYFSAQYAHQQTPEPVQVQHHYAHLLAVMAEHGLTGPVLGFAFDGTGMGDDGTVWGGEVMLADEHSYQRLGHVRPFRLIGGEQAIREPDRVLYALLLEWLTPEQIAELKLGAFRHWPKERYANLHRLWQSSCSPVCSSAGRLFDAWASLLELVERPDYEGECGLATESAAAGCAHHRLALSLEWNAAGVLDWQPALERCIAARELYGREWGQVCSDAFIRALAAAIVSFAELHSGLPVVLGGGVFQNRRLLDELAQIYPSGLVPFKTGSRIPVSDGGIAAGQLWHFLARFHQGPGGSEAVTQPEAGLTTELIHE